ncbi:hypothetical protein [Streptomyces glaucus]|uniref:Secreted protein n=1 Tax=Streptomyces glaucus TaxID=284029 RepID=A0ABP5X3S5_9ACTN
MKWVLLGAVLALYLLYPSLLTPVAELLVKPVPAAFALGLAAGLRARSTRRPAR